MEYLKDYDRWNNLKKEISERNNTPPYFKEGDVWWTYIGANIGYEEDGKGIQFLRPVIIIKKFNQYLFVAIPTTSKIHNSKYYLHLRTKIWESNLILSQVHTYSSKRLLKKITEVEKSKLKEIIICVTSILTSP